MISTYYFFEKHILLHTSCSWPIRVHSILGREDFFKSLCVSVACVCRDKRCSGGVDRENGVWHAVCASGKGSAVKVYKFCLDLEMGQQTLSVQPQMAAAKQLHVHLSLDRR